MSMSQLFGLAVLGGLALAIGSNAWEMHKQRSWEDRWWDAHNQRGMVGCHDGWMIIQNIDMVHAHTKSGKPLIDADDIECDVR